MSGDGRAGELRAGRRGVEHPDVGVGIRLRLFERDAIAVGREPRMAAEILARLFAQLPGRVGRRQLGRWQPFVRR